MLSSASFALCLIVAGGAKAETSHTSRYLNICRGRSEKDALLYMVSHCKQDGFLTGTDERELS